MSKVLIGLTSFNDLALLRDTLPPLEQLRKSLPADVVVMDTGWNDAVRDFLKKHYSAFTYLRHSDGNIGYGQSYNEIWRQFPNHDLYLVVTNDVVLDAPTVKTFVQRLRKDASITMAGGKLHHWDLRHRRGTDNIDSLGISAKECHHFYDRGAGEKDRGQYDLRLGRFFGLTGAAFLFRCDAISRLQREPAGLFDERMWMYKEDIDLAYRLRWMGEKIELFPEVWGWHARSVANREGRGLVALSRADRAKRDYARIHSYKNHFLLLKNNFTWRYGPVVLLKVLFYETAKGLHTLFRSPKAFFAGLATLLFVRGRRSPRRVSARHMLTFFD